jgi:hypothetical protein
LSEGLDAIASFVVAINRRAIRIRPVGVVAIGVVAVSLDFLLALLLAVDRRGIIPVH